MTTRQKTFLEQIVFLYIKSGLPISSKMLIEKYELKISSATVRNEMNALEKDGFLKKSHASSGRIPTNKGFKFYVENNDEYLKREIYEKIEYLFSKRKMSIDFVLDEAAKAISDIANLTLVTSTTKKNERLKSIQLTSIKKDVAIVVLVTSSGRIKSKLLEIVEPLNYSDIETAIKIFNKRLVDTPLVDLEEKIKLISPLLNELIKNYELIIQTFIQKIFNFGNRAISKVYGDKNLIKAPNINRESLLRIFDLLQKQSIWKTIQSNMESEKNLKIEIRNDNIAIMTKKIETNNASREISIIGTNRMNYGQAKEALKILEEIIKGEIDE